MKKKYLIIIVAVAALLAIAIVLEKTHVTNFIHDGSGKSANNGPTAAEKAAEDKVNSDAKKDFVEDTTKTGTPSTTTATPISIELSANQEANNTVTVFTKLHSVSSGSCRLTVANNGGTQTYSADVIYQAEYSTCAGFSVPIKATGTWDIQLSVVSNGQTYTKSITYQVK